MNQQDELAMLAKVAEARAEQPPETTVCCPQPENWGTPGAEQVGGQIIVVDRVYHRAAGRDAVQLRAPQFSRWLRSNEQMWERTLKAVNEWKPIDTGWITEASQLVIVNEEGRNFQVNPTKDQLEDIKGRVIQVGVLLINGYIKVISELPPTEHLRLPPFDLGGWRVRCINNEAQYTVSLTPR